MAVGKQQLQQRQQQKQAQTKPVFDTDGLLTGHDRQTDLADTLTERKSQLNRPTDEQTGRINGQTGCSRSIVGNKTDYLRKTRRGIPTG